MRTFFTLSLLWLPFALFSQNVCSDAILLNLDGDCEFSIYNNTGLTPSGEEPFPTCGFFNDGIDMWFKIESATTTLNIIEVAEASGGIGDMAMQAYTGSCGNLERLACSDDANGLFPYLELSAQEGEDIYLRIYGYGGDDEGEFSMCATQLAFDNEAGNECSDAVVLDVGFEFMFDPYTTTGYTQSNELPSPDCGFFNSNAPDIWFTATVPSTGILIVETREQSGGPSDMAMQSYTGECGSLELVECDDDDGLGTHPRLAFFDRSPGEVLYFRVYEYGGDIEGPFFASAWTIEYGEGDHCPDPIRLAVEQECMLESFTTESLNPSFASTLCISDEFNDIWFDFVVPSSGNVIIETQYIDNGANGLTLSALEGECGNLNTIACISGSLFGNFPILPLYDLTPGQRIYVQAAVEYEGPGPFDICIYEVTTSEGDLCESAIEIPVLDSCEPQVFNTEGFNPSTGFDFSCANTNLIDRWFYVQVPASGNVTIETTRIENEISETALELYDDDCVFPFRITCATDNLPNGQTQITVGGRTPGEVLRIRFSATVSSIEGAFGICAYDPVVPEGNYCDDGFFVPLRDFCNPDIYDNIDYLYSGQGGPFNCGSNGLSNDVWFNTVVAPSGNVTIETRFVEDGIFDVVLQAYNGSCENLNYLDCDDDGGEGNHSLIELTGMIPGETILFKVISYGSSAIGEFGVCVYDPSAEDNDGDGFFASEDCDDDNPNINPGVEEEPYNGIDDDCNEATPDDDLDGDGFGIDEDCDDENEDVYPGAVELAENGIDEDCDGQDWILSNTEDEYLTRISIEPNPAHDIIKIQSEQAIHTIRAFTASGAQIHTSTLENRQLDISQWPAGLYYVNIELIDGNRVTRKVIKE